MQRSPQRSQKGKGHGVRGQVAVSKLRGQEQPCTTGAESQHEVDPSTLQHPYALVSRMP